MPPDLTMDDLMERFHQRFGTGDTCRPETMVEFWEWCQGPDEPTVKYVEDKVQLARRMRMRGDQFALHSAIQGMCDDVCHDVLMLQPTTLPCSEWQPTSWTPANDNMGTTAAPRQNRPTS